MPHPHENVPTEPIGNRSLNSHYSTVHNSKTHHAQRNAMHRAVLVVANDREYRWTLVAVNSKTKKWLATKNHVVYKVSSLCTHHIRHSLHWNWIFPFQNSVDKFQKSMLERARKRRRQSTNTITIWMHVDAKYSPQIVRRSKMNSTWLWNVWTIAPASPSSAENCKRHED